MASSRDDRDHPGADDPSTGVPTLGEPVDLDGLRRERDAAVARVRELEHELGEMRGRVKRLELVMWRRTARRQRLAARVQRVRSMAARRRAKATG